MDKSLDDILDTKPIINTPDAKKSDPPKALTDEQKRKILMAWKEAKEDRDFSLKNFVTVAFGEHIDYRSAEAQLVRQFLTQSDLKFIGATKYIKKDKLILSPEQKKYILNNHEQYTAVEMARTLFQDPAISNLHPETKAVREELLLLDKKGEFITPQRDIKIKFNYSPPVSIVQTLARVRDAVENLEYPEKTEQLNTKQKEEIACLMGFLRSFAFLSKMQSYDDPEEQKIFELNIIRYIYNKPDLTPEEFDQYLTLADQRIIEANTKKNMAMLQGMLDRKIEGEEDDPNIKLSWVEALANIKKELDDCIKRQQEIRKSLVGTRQQRFKEKIQINQSIVQLVEAVKEQERRELMIKHAELRKEKLGKEIDRLSELDDLSVQIFGISKEEIMNGL